MCQQQIQQKSSSKHLIFRIVLASLFSVLTLVFQIIPDSVWGGLKFGGVVIIASGLLLGPLLGGGVGIVTDIIGYLMYPNGPMFPGFTVSQGLTGAIPGFFYRRRAPKVYEIFLIILLTQGVTSLGMVPAMLSWLKGTPYLFELGKALSVQALHIPIYTFAMSLMVTFFTKNPAFLKKLGLQWQDSTKLSDSTSPHSP